MIWAHLFATLLTAAAMLAVEALYLGLVALAHWLERVVDVVSRTPLLLASPTAPANGWLLVWDSRPTGARPGRGPPVLRLPC
jgi:hypothetical protein